MRVQIGLLDIHFSSVKDESHLFAGSRKTWSLPGISRTRASTGLDGFRKKLLHISFDLIVASSKLKWIGKNLGRVGCNLKGGQQKPAPLQPGPDRSQLEAEMDRQKPGQGQQNLQGGQKKPAPHQPGPDRSQLEAEMDRQKPGQDQLRPEGGQ